MHGQIESSQGEDPLTEHCLRGGNKPNQVGAAKVVVWRQASYETYHSRSGMAITFGQVVASNYSISTD